MTDSTELDWQTKGRTGTERGSSPHAASTRQQALGSITSQPGLSFGGGGGGGHQRTFMGTLSASWSWDLLYFKGWQLAVGRRWRLAVGGWRLAVGGWQLVGSGGWRRLVAVGGWWFLGAVLKGCPWQTKKTTGFLRRALMPASLDSPLQPECHRGASSTLSPPPPPPSIIFRNPRDPPPAEVGPKSLLRLHGPARRHCIGNVPQVANWPPPALINAGAHVSAAGVQVLAHVGALTDAWVHSQPQSLGSRHIRSIRVSSRPRKNGGNGGKWGKWGKWGEMGGNGGEMGGNGGIGEMGGNGGKWGEMGGNGGKWGKWGKWGGGEWGEMGGGMGGNGGKWGGNGKLLQVHHGKCMKMFQQERKWRKMG